MSQISLAKPWQESPEYAAYVEAQVVKTTKMAGLGLSRVSELAELLMRFSPHRGMERRRLLSIGCRNDYEIDILESWGFDVVGIDLVAQSPKVVAMDMHRLDFPEASFDVVFACHSLEHAYNRTRAISEILRVLKDGGTLAIEVPVNFPTTEVDRYDFESVTGLWCELENEWVPDGMGDILYASHSPVASGPAVVRLICK